MLHPGRAYALRPVFIKKTSHFGQSHNGPNIPLNRTASKSIPPTRKVIPRAEGRELGMSIVHSIAFRRCSTCHHLGRVILPLLFRAKRERRGMRSGSTRPRLRIAASLTTLRLLARKSGRLPGEGVLALSDESFRAKHERRGVEVDPGGSAPPSPDCEPGALLIERWAPGLLVEAAGIEPAPAQCHCAVIPFHYAPKNGLNVVRLGRLRVATSLTTLRLLAFHSATILTKSACPSRTSPFRQRRKGEESKCRPPVLPRILLVFSQTCNSYTRAAERVGLPGLESNQRPPVSETGLRTGTECLAIEREWTPRCSPSVGSTLVSLCSGPIVKGSLGQEDPRSSSGPREIPMATGQDHKNKKPRARFRGRGLKISLRSR